MALYRTFRKIRLQDVDAAGIVFFPKFLEYCHDAYFEFLEQEGLDLAAGISSGPYILPLVHAEADFRAPLRFGDEVEVIVATAVAGQSSYTVRYLVRKRAGQTLCCEASTVHAAIERTTFKPMKELPERVCAILKLQYPQAKP